MDHLSCTFLKSREGNFSDIFQISVLSLLTILYDISACVWSIEYLNYNWSPKKIHQDYANCDARLLKQWNILSGTWLWPTPTCLYFDISVIVKYFFTKLRCFNQTFHNVVRNLFCISVICHVMLQTEMWLWGELRISIRWYCLKLKRSLNTLCICFFLTKWTYFTSCWI